MNVHEIRIGTRGSALALAQAQLVVDAFEREGKRCRMVLIQTEGDRRASDTAWGEGAFVAAIERALIRGQVDGAVHSAKDIPTREDPRVAIAAFLPRADARDALVVREDLPARSVDALPPGARVGTDSPRRAGFLLARRPDLRVHPFHGNVDTRLARLDRGETDALVIAAAGIDRLGRGARIAERLDPALIPPAPGQGAIAVQVRTDDARMLALAASIDHRATRLGVTAERAFLAAAGGGCRAPIGAIATADDDAIVLFGGYTAPDGSATVFGQARGPAQDPVRVANELAASLGKRFGSNLESGSARIGVSTGRRPRFVVTRARGHGDALVDQLRAAGVEAVHVPSISIEPGPIEELERAARAVNGYDWVVITSANAARALADAARRSASVLTGPRWAAVGEATAQVLHGHGVSVDLRPRRVNAAAIGDELPVVEGMRILLARGDLAGDGLPQALRARGALVDEVVAYRTIEAPDSSRSILRQAVADGPVDAVMFTSGSTVRGFLELARATGMDAAAIPAICIGPETAAEARRRGLRVIAESPTRDVATLAATALDALAAGSEVLA